MPEFARPRILISRCIEFEHCRWNGMQISSDVVKLLKPHVDFVTVCGEADIGLGIPREPVRLVRRDGADTLYQPATGRDLTEDMRSYAVSFLDDLVTVDGFILKNRSPTCGLKDVPVYPPRPKTPALGKTVGLFAQEVVRRFPDYPIEDEGRLTNYGIRDHFLRRVYALASFRQLEQDTSMGALVEFQARNKLLFMAINQSAMRELGRIVANHDQLPADQVVSAYRVELMRALAKPASYGANINVLEHAYGYFRKTLLDSEKTFWRDVLEDYRAGRLPLSVPVSLVGVWIARFENAYLAEQTYFHPYPQDLVAITDSGKGRKI